MEVLLVAGYTALFLFLISRLKFFRMADIPPAWVKFLFVLKVLAGCLLGIIYTYYYTDRTTADTFKFFDDSRILFQAIFNSPKEFLEIFFDVHSNNKECFNICAQMNAWNNQDVLFNDNKTLVRLNVFFQFLSLGKYYVHVVFLNFLSFSGLIALFKLFQRFSSGKSRIIFLVMMFLPSILFWGSGLLKDGLLLFALGLLLYSFNNLVTQKYSAYSTVAFVLSLLLLMFTKLYVLFIIIPALIAWYWSRHDKPKKVIAKFIGCYLIYLLIGFNVDKVSEKYDVVDLIFYKQQNFQVLASITQAKSKIEIPRIDATPWSLIANSPSAVFRVLVRPTLGDSGSVFVLMSAVENIFLIALAIICLIFSDRKKILSIQLLCFSIFFVICMYALIGLITPILGAMVRYKVPSLPFYIFIFISLLNSEKLKSKFPVIQKLM